MKCCSLCNREDSWDDQQKVNRSYPGMTYELLHYFLTVNHEPLTGCETADEVYELLDPTETTTHRHFFLKLFLIVQFLQDKKKSKL